MLVFYDGYDPREPKRGKRIKAEKEGNKSKVFIAELAMAS